MNHKLNIGKQIKHFGRVNRTICSTVLRYLFLTKPRKETHLAWIVNLTSVTAVVQCANRVQDYSFPIALRSITAIHCFADPVFARICIYQAPPSIKRRTLQQKSKKAPPSNKRRSSALIRIFP